MSRLIQEIKQRIKESGAKAVGLAACDPAPGRSLLVNPDLSFHPASTFKVCVMMEIFRQAEAGQFSLDDPLTVTNEFRSIVDQSPFSLSIADDAETELYSAIGAQRTIRHLVTRMITHSSNLATNILIEQVSPPSVDTFMRELGAEGLLVLRGVEDQKAYALGLNNAATARSLMHILSKLALGRVVSPAASAEMLNILKKQHFNEGIPSQLPAEIVIAHKTGWNGLIYHDAAILYPPNQPPYVLVILTSGLSDQKEAPELVASLSRSVYDSQTQWRL